MQILIVGAGPSGLTAAVELARHGIKAELIDKRDNASGFSRAVGITSNSLQLLEPSGATDQLLAEGIQIECARIFNGKFPLLELRWNAEISEGKKLLALAQDRTEAILLERLQAIGGSIQYNSELTSLKIDQSNVLVTINDGNEVTYDYVIAADGVKSSTRHFLGLEFPGFDLGEDWSIADADIEEWFAIDSFSIFLLQQGNVVVVVPLEEKRVRVISSTVDAIAALPVPLSIKNIRRAGTFRISVRSMEDYRHGPVFFIGDAAHTHSPVGGRGMNLGIADAAELAEKFASGKQDEYGPVRHREAAKIIRASESGRKILTSANPIVRFFARMIIRIVGSIPPLRLWFVQNIVLD
ncbi:MAG: FAD-dependent oxidoreductase [Rhizobiaceae bacterium]